MASLGGVDSENASSACDEAGDRRAHLRVLPPAANWYCSQVCDWGYDARGERWLVVYGAKNGVCIYEFQATEPAATPPSNSLDAMLRRPLRVQFVALVPRGKKDGRVTALQCTLDATGELRIVCGGEEGAVQIWDSQSLTRIDQHRKHNGTEVTAISSLDSNWIVAGDRQGVISLWERDRASVQTFSPVPREAVFAMDIAPFDKRLVAVGYRSGALCVVDVVDKTVRYRLDGHELEVQSVVWAAIDVANPPVNYLATASRDRSIKVWAFPYNSTDDGAAPEPYLCARIEVRKPQQASSHSQSTRLWLPLAWTYDITGEFKFGLWTGSFEGNLQLFLWNGPPTGTIKPTAIVKNGHNRLLFGIVSLSKWKAKLSSKNGSSSNNFPSLMMTISLDRDLRVWREDLAAKNVGVLTCIERIPAQGGFTYSLDLNTSRKLLACGVGDQTIRVWNLASKQSAGGYQSELVWKGLQSKITCVRWHPMQEQLLAFGTEDGRVGVWDARSKSARRLKVGHSGEVHQLQWTIRTITAVRGGDTGGSFQEAVKALEEAQSSGQSLEDTMAQQQGKGSRGSSDEVAIFLWSCDRSGNLYRTDVDNDVSSRIRNDCTSFEWDALSSILAIGSNVGKVELMAHRESTQFEKTEASLESHSSIFEHKESVTAVSWSNDNVTSGDLLASGTKSGEIIVCEGVGVSSHSTRHFSSLPGYGENVVAAFKAHTGTVNCLRWSPNVDHYLLGSCGDDGCVKIWNAGERSLVSSFHFHTNRVFSIAWITSSILSSCGQDQSIRLWEYQNHSPSVNHAKPTQRSTSHTHPVNLQHPVEIESEVISTPVTPKSNSKTRAKKRIDKKESMFSTKNPLWMLSAGRPANVLRKSTQQGIAGERTRLEEEGKIDEAAQLYFLEGRVGDALRLLARHSMLNAAWISYAPMAGHEVWREVSILYANQLKVSGDYKGAALQHLAVGQVESAADCFITGGMFPEAIALLISRFGSSHPLLKSIMWQYAEKLEKKKKSEEAVSAYLSIGSHESNIRAVTILATSGCIANAKQAMAVWKNTCDQARDNHQEDVSVLPSSIFLSVCRLALAHDDFPLVTEAICGLMRNSNQQTLSRASLSPQQTVYVLSLIATGIASTLHERTIGDLDCTDIINQTGSTANEAKLFIEALQASIKISWSTLVEQETFHAPAPASPGAFWFYSLAKCQENGLWCEDNDLKPDDVVELLGEHTVFDFLLIHSQNDVINGTMRSQTHELICYSRLILKILAELLSGYLLSALEVLRDLMSAFVASSQDQLPLLVLLFPNGPFDAMSPPLFGELADEENDTRGIWVECCLLEHQLLFRHLRQSLKTDEETQISLGQLMAHVDDIVNLRSASEKIQGQAHLLQNEIKTFLHQRVRDDETSSPCR